MAAWRRAACLSCTRPARRAIHLLRGGPGGRGREGEGCSAAREYSNSAAAARGERTQPSARPSPAWRAAARASGAQASEIPSRQRWASRRDASLASVRRRNSGGSSASSCPSRGTRPRSSTSAAAHSSDSACTRGCASLRCSPAAPAPRAPCWATSALASASPSSASRHTRRTWGGP
eukprot:5159603-Pyramimonas_sp.AAC.1